jgi:predicted nuclease with TOPRIM domain
MTDHEPPPEQPDCCAPRLALSHEEEEVLRRMRELRAEFRAAKDQLARAAVADRARLEERLEQLRLRFRDCQAELARANREKMRRLGHEP